MIAALFAILMTALGLAHPAAHAAAPAGHGHVISGAFGGQIGD